MELDNQAIWFPKLPVELSRHVIQVRMDAKMSEPWKDRTFTIQNIAKWTDQHRADIVFALLVLIKNWRIGFSGEGRR